MLIRIAAAVLNVAGLLALVAGVLLWLDLAANLTTLHMLLGFLAVGALWTIALAQAGARGGSWTVAVCGVAVGALTILLGLYQSALLVGPMHWIVDLSHLILGLLTIGLGHMGAARYRRGSAA
jgi:hypothetical protein